MQRISVYTLLFLLCGKYVFSQEGEKYIRFGIIPYQICSRGPAAYFAKDGKKFSYEFRPAYTIATKWVTYMVPTQHDKYFFQGLNLNFLFRKYSPYRKSPRILVGYRYWWYNKQAVSEELYTVSTASSYSRGQYKSKWKHGLLLGAEFCKQFDFEPLDLNLFFNAGVVFYEGREFIYNVDQNRKRLDTYYRTSKVERADFVAALGLKIGLAKRINP